MYILESSKLISSLLSYFIMSGNDLISNGFLKKNSKPILERPNLCSTFL